MNYMILLAIVIYMGISTSFAKPLENSDTLTTSESLRQNTLVKNATHQPQFVTLDGLFINPEVVIDGYPSMVYPLENEKLFNKFQHEILVDYRYLDFDFSFDPEELDNKTIRVKGVWASYPMNPFGVDKIFIAKSIKLISKE